MAILSPLPLTADLLNGVLTKVRRGVALARMNNTADFTTGIMCDLPEKIDFELSVVRTHQGLTRNTTITEIELGAESEIEAETSTLLGSELESSASSGIGVEGESERESSSTLGLSADSESVLSSDRDSSSSVSALAGSRNSQTGEVGNTSGTRLRNSLEGENEGSREGTNRASKTNTNSTSNRNNLFTKRSSTGKTEAECSDKCVTANTQRNYWRLDESSGAVAQAS